MRRPFPLDMLLALIPERAHVEIAPKMLAGAKQ
jgi:hypothetical protein